MFRFLSGINAWNEIFTKETLKKIENHWKLKIPSKKFDENNAEDKLYILTMFPYPSGQLHMGHVRVYGTGDVLARYFRMKGKNVLFPMGWDAFGLPAENAAIERGVNPHDWTQKNIANMKSVMEELNFSFNWDREFATCDSEYFKWTQFFFIKLFERGLVYRREALVNWDPVDKTVLADEQVDANGCSWRSGAVVEKKMLRQWFVKTTVFAKTLLEGLEDPILKGWNDIVDIQKHWIGDVCGTTIDFKLVDKVSGCECDKMPIWLENPEYIDRAKFVAVKTDSFWTFDCNTSSLLPFKVRNPFTNEVLPVYKTDDVSFADGAEIHLGIPEINDLDRKFADLVGLKYNLENRVIASEEDLLSLRKEICSEAQKRDIGGYPTSSKLRDWLISRQRYWGTPIPIVHCKACGEQPVSLEELPVKLPHIKTIKKGENPLESQTKWLNTKCPKCGGEAKRETDTMDTFVDSSWYFLRYLDPDNQGAAFDVEKIKKLMPVDIYIGGKEHATLHLFFARFMNHFLFSYGVVPHREPFAQLLCQGIIKGATYKIKETGQYVPEALVISKDGKLFHKETNEVLIRDWEKMSKSKGNAVEPTTLMAEYGVDLTRMLVLNASSPKSELNWNEKLSEDIFKWQRRMWLTVCNFINCRSLNKEKPELTKEFQSLEYYIFDSRNFYLQTITNLMERDYNLGTAMRKMQGLTNSLRKCNEEIMAHSLQFERALALQIILLAPFAPYFASELWAGFLKAPNRLCDSGEILWDQSVFQQPWPLLDSNYKRIVTDFSKSGNEDSEQEKTSEILDKIKKVRIDRKTKQLEKKAVKKKAKDVKCP